jgi:hypothetical protein
VRPEGLGKLEKIHLIGTRSHDLPAYNFGHIIYMIRESVCYVHIVLIPHCCVIAEFCFPRYIVAFADVDIHIFMRLLRTSDIHQNGNQFLFVVSVAVLRQYYYRMVCVFADGVPVLHVACSSILSRMLAPPLQSSTTKGSQIRPKIMVHSATFNVKGKGPLKRLRYGTLL